VEKKLCGSRKKDRGLIKGTGSKKKKHREGPAWERGLLTEETEYTKKKPKTQEGQGVFLGSWPKGKKRKDRLPGAWVRPLRTNLASGQKKIS